MDSSSLRCSGSGQASGSSSSRSPASTPNIAPTVLASIRPFRRFPKWRRCAREGVACLYFHHAAEIRGYRPRQALRFSDFGEKCLQRKAERKVGSFKESVPGTLSSTVQVTGGHHFFFDLKLAGRARTRGGAKVLVAGLLGGPSRTDHGWSPC